MKIYLYSLTAFLACLQSGVCDEAAAKKKQLNDAMAERATLMVEAHKAEEKLEKSWFDKSLTSPEIEKLRAHYQRLKFEMVDVREKLKVEVKKLPEVQKKVAAVETMRIKQKSLEKKIDELKNKKRTNTLMN